MYVFPFAASSGSSYKLSLEFFDSKSQEYTPSGFTLGWVRFIPVKC